MSVQVPELGSILDRFKLPQEVVEFAWDHYADQTALIAPGWQLTYAQLQARVQRLVRALTAMGLRKSDVCYLQLASAGDQVQVLLADMQIGAILIGVPRQAGPQVLELFCGNVAPAGFVYEANGEADAAWLQQRIPGIALCRYDLLAEESATELVPIEPPDLSPDDIGLIGFSSGTTGAPKALQASYGTYLAGVHLFIKHVLPAQHAGPKVTLVCIPVAGAGSGVVLPTWYSGGVLVLPAVYSAEEFLRLIPLHRVTNIFITPSFLIDLLDHPLLDSTDLSSLRGILYGTELMPAAKIEEALRRFGPILKQGYGSAEVLPPVTMLQPDEHMRDGQPAPRSVLSSVGRAVPEVQISIVDEDDNNLPGGAVGHVLIKSPTQFKGYLNRPDANANVLRNGWLHIGDIGFLDDEGRLHVLGRGPDLIRRAGHVTYPRTVEEVLHDHPAVKETAYVQVGDKAVMAVSLRQRWRDRVGDASLASELKAFLAERVPGPDAPDDIRMFVELPRSPLGKVLRREVRVMLTA